MNLRSLGAGLRGGKKQAVSRAPLTFLRRILILIAILSFSTWSFQRLRIGPSAIQYVETPEVYFPYRSESLQIEVQETAKAGFRNMRQMHVVVAGLVRNVGEDGVLQIQTHVAELRQHLGKVTTLLVENDSTDNTRRLLLAWAAKDPAVFVLGCGVNAPQCMLRMAETIGHPLDAGRIEKMARMRNVILDFLRLDDLVPSFDYLFMWDFDISGRLYVDGVAHSLAVMGMVVRYDLPYSLESVIIPAADAFAYRTGSGYMLTDQEAWRRFYNVKRGDPPHLVRSCFGGFAIYRPSVLQKGARYDFAKDKGNITCEHVFFHYPLLMYQNPSMIYAIVSNENSLSVWDRLASVTRWWHEITL